MKSYGFICMSDCSSWNLHLVFSRRVLRHYHLGQFPSLFICHPSCGCIFPTAVAMATAKHHYFGNLIMISVVVESVARWIKPSQPTIRSLTSQSLPHSSVSDMLFSSFALFLLQCATFCVFPGANALSLERRELLVWPIGAGGAILYGKLISGALQKLSRGEAYPDAHEQRVESILSSAVAASIPPAAAAGFSPPQRPLRLLEVGIGTECRVARRGLYKSAIQEAASRGATEIEITGVDIASPREAIVDEARAALQRIGAEHDVRIDFQFTPGSITSKLDVADGYFDCVFTALTLCSVDDQVAALREIKRLIRREGGTFGFVEHVAVNPDEPYRILEFQQTAFDPLQQAVAGNCHLHRYTENAISEVFELDTKMSSRKLFGERFLVEGMWPVSCQSSGVVQRVG
jgi:SAM-dependent methyltransferase